MKNAKAYDKARETLKAISTAFPAARDATVGAELAYRRLARAQDSGEAWFGLGLYGAVNGNIESAVTAYRTALSRALGPGESAYAAKAIQRLAPQS